MIESHPSAGSGGALKSNGAQPPSQKQLIILCFPDTGPSIMEKILEHLKKLEIERYDFLIINKELHSISKQELLQILKEASAL